MTVKNTSFLDACDRKQPVRTPVWFMRQAGRYLPSYRRIKGDRSVTEVVKDPNLAAELAVDAVRALDVDAAIMFADIMLPLAAMGVPFTIEANLGPIVKNPIRTLDDVNSLETPDLEADVGYVFDGIDATIQKLDDAVPLIGFAGAPFTLAGYMVEGRPSRDLERTKEMMYREPETWALLMGKLARMTKDYLSRQVSHGVDAVQLFDSWAGCLSPVDYRSHVLSYTREINHSLDGKVPRIHFCADSAALFEEFLETGADVLSVDWRIQIDDAWDRSADRVGIQGNLDPVLALSGGEPMRLGVEAILEQSRGRRGHVFSLGHGVLRETAPENLRRVVRMVHEETERA